MSETSQDDPKKQELEVLRRAFTSFTEVTEQLQKSYDNLQLRIQQLDLELARKNEELEQNLQEKEEVKNYLDFILQSLTNGVIVVDREGCVTTFNKTAGQICGLDPELCLGKPLTALFTNDRLLHLIERLADSEESTMTQEQEMKTNDGNPLKVRVTASPANDNKGELIGTVLVLQDVTQLKRLEEEANRNDRLRAMGEMAAGIAHEIRNPMGGIELFASLLKKDLAEDPEKGKLADHIVSGIRNLDRIISSLLLFAKSPEPSQRKCNLNTLLEDILAEPEMQTIPDNIKIQKHYHPKAALGTGDGELLQQVFVNFLRNAVQAMPEGGTLSLTTEESESPESDSYHRRFVAVTIQDTGTGIPPAERNKIFNPFFTTKDHGTGLGLAIAHNIIKAHQGTIDVESEEGRGTAFIVKIPIWEEY
ncbi:MAG: PAS domain-containing protein [Candidatus Nitronauta litoralis]|uniref:histidine kinase n=1 Tax=Candidatus Nitronauta litoralis TaxID=2705533 RepID=A0A7T0BU88_9BACT|nr:MAG: PAS domain-containing protein [Candidatus Nitronauta litoralis]